MNTEKVGQRVITYQLNPVVAALVYTFLPSFANIFGAIWEICIGAGRIGRAECHPERPEETGAQGGPAQCTSHYNGERRGRNKRCLDEQYKQAGERGRRTIAKNY
jgi:hypothetical protein